MHSYDYEQRRKSGNYTKVLILVVMEDALVQTSAFVLFEYSSNVLILVVMEDALVLSSLLSYLDVFLSLNPCCNGRCTRT